MAFSQLFTVGKGKEGICLGIGIFLQICFDSFDTFELAEKNHVCKKEPT